MSDDESKRSVGAGALNGAAPRAQHCKRQDLDQEALWRGWLAVRKRVLKRDGKCATACQARREAVVRYLEKKTRREFKNLFKCGPVSVDDPREG